MSDADKEMSLDTTYAHRYCASVGREKERWKDDHDSRDVLHVVVKIPVATWLLADDRAYSPTLDDLEGPSGARFRALLLLSE